MPWTFAHPVAVLPFYKLGRHRVSLMALVIGSMAPDLAYYLFAFDLATLAHQWRGVFLVCLPLGWITFLFLRQMRAHFVYLLPQTQRQALQSHPGVPESLSGWQPVCISLALIFGALTHIVWDAFTHKSGFAVAYFSALREPVHLLGASVPVFHLLQHVSTLFGVLVLAYTYLKWLRNLPHIVILEPRENDHWRYLLFASTAFTSVLLASPLAYFWSKTADGSLAVEAFMFHLALSGTSSFAILFSIAALLIARARAEMQPGALE